MTRNLDRVLGPSGSAGFLHEFEVDRRPGIPDSFSSRLSASNWLLAIKPTPATSPRNDRQGDSLDGVIATDGTKSQSLDLTKLGIPVSQGGDPAMDAITRASRLSSSLDKENLRRSPWKLAKLAVSQRACRPDALCQFDVIPAAVASDGSEVGGAAAASFPASSRREIRAAGPGQLASRAVNPDTPATRPRMRRPSLRIVAASVRNSRHGSVPNSFRAVSTTRPGFRSSVRAARSTGS